MSAPLRMLLCAALCGAAAYPPSSQAQPQVAVPVPYITGGVGEGEREQLMQEARQNGYNLKVVTAAAAGNYLADARVTVTDAQGTQVLEAALDGPWLLLKVPPGRYTVAATDGNAVKKRTVQVPATGMREVTLTWPRPETGGEPTREHVPHAGR